MKFISSAHNPTIKHVRKLVTTASYRTKQQQTVLEGVHLCESYLQQSKDAPQLCVVSETSTSHNEVAPLVAALKTTEIIVVPDTLFATMSQLEHGVGILFIISLPSSRSHAKVAKTALLLDDVQDPGNLGTMLRTAAAAGVEEVFLSEGCARAWSPKVLRAGMGAQFVLRIYEDVDLVATITGATIPVLATSLYAKKSLYSYDLTDDVAWLFGSEGRGISPRLEQLCHDTTVIIPQQKEVESLNVAAATAVCLFEQRRQQLATTQ